MLGHHRRWRFDERCFSGGRFDDGFRRGLAVVALGTGASVTDELAAVAVSVVLSLEAGSVDKLWSLHALSARRKIGTASQDFFNFIAIASFCGLVGVCGRDGTGVN